MGLIKSCIAKNIKRDYFPLRICYEVSFFHVKLHLTSNRLKLKTNKKALRHKERPGDLQLRQLFCLNIQVE